MLLICMSSNAEAHREAACGRSGVRAHYTTYFKLRFGELPELHANPATTAGVYERSKVVSRRAL